ncbi:Protein of unknown function (DUF1471) [Serratia sp. FGI94]|uniref:multiple stress resistance protein BhsA n=1 Tax=Serratia sp. FGI94 TaxID=671990 RepID=UPI0002A7272F|nr:YdgH/BhsA/McbA-like domain containing protein [Serratia sp. FGI94]AGB84351.1 Protein of unknown function (DUF1471) [Serratia sp. FGI94]
MKNIKKFATALLLTGAAFTATAAEQPAAQPAANAQKVGVISVSGAASLSALEDALASKAAAAGASSYRITSAGGQNKLHGTAEIFN